MTEPDDRKTESFRQGVGLSEMSDAKLFAYTLRLTTKALRYAAVEGEDFSQQDRMIMLAHAEQLEGVDRA